MVMSMSLDCLKLILLPSGTKQTYTTVASEDVELPNKHLEDADAALLPLTTSCPYILLVLVGGFICTPYRGHPRGLRTITTLISNHKQASFSCEDFVLATDDCQLTQFQAFS